MKKNKAANFVGQAAASARQAIEQANARARYQTAMQAVARYHATYTDAFADKVTLLTSNPQAYLRQGVRCKTKIISRQTRP